MSGLTHFDADGRAVMVDVSGKPSTTTAQHVLHDYGEDGPLAAIVDGGACRVGLESRIVTLNRRAAAPGLGVPCRRRWRGESGFIFAHAVEAGVHAWSGRVFRRVVEVMEGPCVQCSEEEVGSTQTEAVVLQR